VAVAVAVAAEHGLRCDDPEPIGQSSNVLVHLRPAPVVARVMTATAALHSDVRGWLERELSVAGFAAAAGAPVVAPTDLLPPGPHERDGLWLSFWELASPRADGREISGADAGRSLRELHDALAAYPHELPPFSDAFVDMESIADDELRPALEAAARMLAENDLPRQALHGDTSLSNLLDTDRGPLWNDFEDVCHGPVAWDLAGVIQSGELRGRPAEFGQEVLNAYGDAPGSDDLAPLLEAHRLYHSAWARRR
jgi:phosphotransferase family enzyme